MKNTNPASHAIEKRRHVLVFVPSTRIHLNSSLTASKET